MGYIYLIYDEGLDAYKIGVTRSINSRRVKALQTGNATELRIIYLYKCEYPFRLETMLHNRFKNDNIKNEWFNLSDRDVLLFLDTCNELNQTIQQLKCNPYFAKNLK